MAHVYLVHWQETELVERVARLEKAGHRVTAAWEEGGAPLRAIKKNPPDVAVIDLSRLPSHGRHVATALREAASTRELPIVFVAGDPEKVARLREAVPDAVYAPWSRIRSAITRAIVRPPRASAPSRPASTAGYSGTPLPKKLGIAAGRTLMLLGAPDAFLETLGTLPDDVRVVRRAQGEGDVIVLFATAAADLERRFGAAHRALAPSGGGLWIAWPKKTSGVATDLDGNVVRAFGLESGLVDNKVCAIDETWSGLRFVQRRT